MNKFLILMILAILIIPVASGATAHNNPPNIIINSSDFQVSISKEIPEIMVITRSGNYSITYSDILLIQNNEMISDYSLSGNWSVTTTNSQNKLYGKYMEITMSRVLTINTGTGLNIAFQFLMASKAYNKTVSNYTGTYNIPINNRSININIMINRIGQISSKFIILKQEYRGFIGNLSYTYMQRNYNWENISVPGVMNRLSGPENYMSVGLLYKNQDIGVYNWSNYLSNNIAQNFSTYYNFQNDALDLFFFYPNSPSIVHDPVLTLPGSILSAINSALNQARQFILENIYSMVIGMTISVAIISLGFLIIKRKE